MAHLGINDVEVTVLVTGIVISIKILGRKVQKSIYSNKQHSKSSGLRHNGT
jgi:hypothetical protein